LAARRVDQRLLQHLLHKTLLHLLLLDRLPCAECLLAKSGELRCRSKTRTHCSLLRRQVLRLSRCTLLRSILRRRRLSADILTSEAKCSLVALLAQP
jgi:hypothetical protein